LEEALRGPLPGTDAHALLAPIPRRAWPPDMSLSAIRDAAGLLLVFPIDGAAHVVLTVRADTLGRHGGQISLPGGVIEPGETLVEAALREAHEEVGLAGDAVDTLGALTPVDIHVSGFRLHPIVGTMNHRPTLHPADGEVARVLEIPVADLFAPRSFVWRTIERDGRSLQVPTLVAQGAEIWGATAMVLAEFLRVLGWTGPPE
jgi:8-oxo-dGTP pyrophosphatase MutT (NUDIX family)